jgi:hypothetical protein
MKYETIFDLSNEGLHVWPGPVIAVLLLVTGAALIVASARVSQPSWRSFRRIYPLLFFGFAVIWTGVTAFGIYREYREISVAMTEHRLELVEGRVSDFTPMPYTGHTMERFCVRNVCFAYSDYVHTFGFHNTVSHGGPIRDGLGVRIAYVGNVIVRLDVATTRPIHPGATRSDT